MILGYSIIAVPTGIISAEMTKYQEHDSPTNGACDHCGELENTADANYCQNCGKKITLEQTK